MRDEEYVRSVWISNIRVSELNWYALDGLSAQQWAECAEFTRERLEQIRQVEEEIRLLQSMVILLSTERGDETAPVYKRTIARLEVVLAELKQGMKDQERV